MANKNLHHDFGQIKKTVLTAWLFLRSLFQLTGDVLWKMHTYPYSCNVWRESSYIFFIPAGILFAKIVERKSFNWAIISCALFVIGCVTPFIFSSCRGLI
jgi:hypothetical protein